MGRLNVNLCGIEMDNPVIPASGTFGFGYEFAELYDINCLGTFSFKGTTLEPRFGNPTPRIAECPDGMINAVGLQNPGVDRVISEELPKLAEVEDTQLMLAGLQPEDDGVRGLQTAGPFSCPRMGLFTTLRMTPPLTEPPESGKKDRKGLLAPPSVEGRWPFSL